MSSRWQRSGRAPIARGGFGGATQGTDRCPQPNRVWLLAGVWTAYAFGAILIAIWGLGQPATPLTVTDDSRASSARARSARARQESGGRAVPLKGNRRRKSSAIASIVAQRTPS